MKQAVLKNGKVFSYDVPVPAVSKGRVVVKVVNSCISTGTETASLNAGRQSIVKQAIKHPEKIRKALDILKKEGFSKLYKRINTDELPGKALGYSAAGIVYVVGDGVGRLKVGDRVAVAGAGYANHAEYVEVPENLVVKISDNVDFKSASMITIASIALQGVRRLKPEFGEIIVVYGAGLIGQIAVQLLVNSGALVVVVDVIKDRVELAIKNGAYKGVVIPDEDPVKVVEFLSERHGADAVLFCASTNQSEALSQAFNTLRRKGRLVMVGVWGDKVLRDDMYKKEIDFLISCSYGPGRYDGLYEEDGVDYPYAYVRWTENRNMQAINKALASGRLDFSSLFAQSFPIEAVVDAYRALSNSIRPISVILDYGSKIVESFDLSTENSYVVSNNYLGKDNKLISVGVIGAGAYASNVHLPNLKACSDKYRIRAISTRTGLKGKELAEKYNVAYVTTDYKKILDDKDIDLVFICTRHNLHSQIVLEALNRGKNVFVEKPLGTNIEDLNKIKAFFSDTTTEKKPMLTVGFNRRFSPLIRRIKDETVQSSTPLLIDYTMNVPYIGEDSWVQKEEGAGRIIGEACHIFDLFSYLVESPVVGYSVGSLSSSSGNILSSDNKVIQIEYSDGSVGVLKYFTVGSKDLPKERLSVHFDEKTIEMEDYKSISYYGFNLKSEKGLDQDKGQKDQLKAVYRSLKGDGILPISLQSIFETSEISIKCS